MDADYRKDQRRLLTKWAYIPIEVAPIAAHSVLSALTRLGSQAPVVRQNAVAKAGPVKTDQDFFIIDAPFQTLLTSEDVKSGSAGSESEGRWEVEALAQRIKTIPGVLEVGLFVGKNGEEALKDGGQQGGQKPVAAYFGMPDGSVKVRHHDKPQ